jgi:hypothetical protein
VLAGGYEVAWRNASTGQYTVWDTDSNGNLVGQPFGAVDANDPRLEQLETTFGQDLNRDGTIGINTNDATVTPIQKDGLITIVKIAGKNTSPGPYYALDNSSGAGPLLEYQNTPVTAGEFSPWTPIGAAQLAGGGYEMAWKNASNGKYTVWDTDGNGNLVGQPFGAVAGNDPRLEQLETTFGQDLNSDGTTGLVGDPTQTLQTDGSVSLVEIANQYYALDNSSGDGPLLEHLYMPVAAGGAWTPIGAAALAGGGYEVAWRNASTGQYTVWDTDGNGNLVSQPFGAVAGNDPRLEQLETTFDQDLNGDGTIGINDNDATITPIQKDGLISLVEITGKNANPGPYYALDNSSIIEGAKAPDDGNGAGPLVEYQNTPVTAGQLEPWAPIGAATLAGGGYEVAWKNASTGQYTVWDTDGNGNFVSNAIGVVSSESFGLEDLEPSFGQDLNGDGWLSTQLVTTAPSNGVVNLTGQTQPTTVNLGANGASASAGMNASSLSFARTPDDVTFGSGKSILEYAMAPSSGVDEIENFAYGADLLNLDLLGGSNSSLMAFDTTVGGNHAIALASSSNLLYGVVLLNMPSGDTAADLLASHVTFAGGHALVS